MDKVLQTGLTAGMSSVSGFHSNKPNWVDHKHAGKNVMPQNFCPDPKSRVTFATAKEPPVTASYLCIGAWPWGDTATFHWNDSELPAVQEAWKLLHDAGINFLDTAEAYGDGKSEVIIGQLVKGLPRDSFVVQTKWLSTPTMLANYLHPVDAAVKSCEASLKRLELDYVDIYLVHGHIHPGSIAQAAKGMAKCVELGLARAVGVANYTAEDTLKFKEELAKHGVPLATNQCEFSVLRRYPELTGEIASARQEGSCVFQSYSSLGQGRLSGKYTADNPPPRTYRFSSYPMEDLEPVLETLRSVAERRGKNVASVSLNYCISKGALPVVGIRNPDQARDAIGALGWRLTDEEVVEIDKVSIEGQKTILWQQG